MIQIKSEQLIIIICREHSTSVQQEYVKAYCTESKTGCKLKKNKFKQCNFIKFS